MGAWGVGLFSDDTACDVRDTYRQAAAEGLEADTARDRVLERFANALEDKEDGPVVWLALAATAWDMGRLDDATRDRALEVIAQGEGIDRWEEAGLGAKRRAELAKLTEKLRQPQKPLVKAKAKRGFATDWTLGEIIGYRQQGGNLLALHVVAHSDGGTGVFPVVHVLDWTSDGRPPTEAEIAGADSILFLPSSDPSLPMQPELCLLLTRKMERAECFVRWGPHKQPVATAPLRTEDLSYVGPAMFEQDLVGRWRAERG